jgi:acetyl esterase
MRAKIEFWFLTFVMRLPRLLLRWVAGRPTEKDGQQFDLHSQAFLRIVELSKQPTMEQVGVERGRRYMDARSPALNGPPRQLARVEDRTIPVADGQIAIRVYAPSIGAALPALVYFHGGGFVLGSIASHDRLCRILAAEAECAVISVEYRRAPEHRFPVAADDALSAFRWVRDHAADLGVIADRIAVGGDSAGGNLSAGVCLACVKNGEASPCYQWLAYPVTDLTNESRSYKLFADGFYLTRTMMEWFTGSYLRSDADRSDPRASPLVAESHVALPPAWVMTAGFDPLRDEGTEYAQKLAAAGVSVKHQNYPSLFHGVFSMTGILPAARAALTDGITDLRKHLRG